MHTATAKRIHYLPKGYRTEILGSVEVNDEAKLSEIERAVLQRYPQANSFEVAHPVYGNPWAAGTL